MNETNFYRSKPQEKEIGFATNKKKDKKKQIDSPFQIDLQAFRKEKLSFKTLLSEHTEVTEVKTSLKSMFKALALRDVMIYPDKYLMKS
jgi:hypothetical protein